MPDWSNVSNLTREELADFCKSLRQIKFFENLADNSNLTPSIIEDVQITADAAFALATVAAELARRANKDEVTYQRPTFKEHIPALLQPTKSKDEDCCMVFQPIAANPTSIIGAVEGWAQYQDTVYTSGSPFTILDGSTTTLPNNAGSKIETYLPAGIVSFYDAGTQKITPGAVGDYNILTVRFKATATTAVTHVEFGVDIGGAMGVIFKDIKVFPKGAGFEHNFSFVCPGYSLNTFIANGGAVKLMPDGGDIDVYGIEFQFARVYSA